MPLKYKAAQNALPSKDGKKKWVPRLVKYPKSITTERLAEEMSYATMLPPGAIHHVLRSLGHYMFPHLLNSRSVHLDGVGTFTVIANCVGNSVETPEEVSPKQIKYLRVRFTPEYVVPVGEGKTRTQFLNVEYERVDGIASSAGSGSGEDDDDGGGGFIPDPNA